MHNIADWLEFIDLRDATVRNVIASYRRGALADTPFALTDTSRATQGFCSRDDCYHDLVVPALAAGFCDAEAISCLLQGVAFAGPSTINPHTVDRGADLPPLISMPWHNRAEDVICLAHEAAHALQILLSPAATMPPLARETAAFLGELLLLRHAQQKAPDLFPGLHQVWIAQNKTYLGSDLDALSDALGDRQNEYHYRQNYPVARLAAVHIFQHADDILHRLFSSGDKGMGLLPIQAMTCRAKGARNCLPVMPQAARFPAIDVYRRLGAIGFLDLQGAQGRSKKRIRDYYADLSDHLRAQSAFIGLNARGQPMGYATWTGNPATGDVMIIHDAAPFGDGSDFHDQLWRHIGLSGDPAGPSGDEIGPRPGHGVNIDPYAGLGYAIELLALSGYHRNFRLADYLCVEILPALSAGQLRFYLTDEGIPTGMVTWAWLSADIERQIHETGRALSSGDWRCGERLFFNDWITPYENIREVLHDMTHNIFPDQRATGLRRNPDGSVRRVNRWTGAKLRKSKGMVFA